MKNLNTHFFINFMESKILVVPKKVLFEEGYFEGFIHFKEKKEYLTKILKNSVYKKRTEKLENNPSLKQIIPYVWIINPKTKKVFVYKRSSDKKYTEPRLWNFVSCGVGGHIEKNDEENPIENAMMRELKEEISMEKYPTPKIIGYLNLDCGNAEKFHFGIIAVAETEEEIKLNEGEIVEGKFMKIEELEKLFNEPNSNVESWTKVSWPFVKNYFLSNA